MDLSCRQLTGAQAIADIDVVVVEGLQVPIPQIVDDGALAEAYREMRGREIRGRIAEECEAAARRRLDDVIFDSLGLRRAGRQRIYHTLVALVHDRLDKARSV